MSYIINIDNPFVSTKLTEIGREKLAKGQLNFSSWALGDSEVNYQREELVENNSGVGAYSGTTRILRPKDNMPNFEFFVTKEPLDAEGSPLYTLTGANIRTIKLTVNNEAENRGFFSGDTDDWTILTGSSYVKDFGEISGSTITGGTNVEIPTLTYNIGDLIMFKFTNSTLGDLGVTGNTEPVPTLWYQIQESASTTTIGLDRNLPNLSGESVNIQYYVYPHGGELYDNFGSGTTTAYWDKNTLAFNSGCDVSIKDMPIWNMNIPFSETLQGVNESTHEDFTKYGSYNYIGQKDPYFNYDMETTGTTNDSTSIIDPLKKSIGIIHYTNKTISNFYGEFLYVDSTNNKLTKIHIPTLMYHRRYFVDGTENGNKIGMTFISDSTLKTINNTDIEYYDLIEDPNFIYGDDSKVVGKIFPQLKMIIFTDDEIVAAMSYKSNRNWTLPNLSLELQAPNGLTGALNKGETLFATYMLTNNSGLTTTLPCQYYSKLTNNLGTSKDIQFRLSDVDRLPYMRKIEKLGYDGRGFYANNFKLLYQIVDDNTDRPDPNNWKVYDFTNTGMTSGGTIDPIKLENQSPSENGFILTDIINSISTSFELNSLMDIPLNTEPEILQFGDERFFYGNIESYIGARIYKTLFEITINASEFQNTNNLTKLNDDGEPTNIRVSEVGIYDNESNLVVVGKLSKPVELINGSVITFELSMDF